MGVEIGYFTNTILSVMSLLKNKIYRKHQHDLFNFDQCRPDICIFQKKYAHIYVAVQVTYVLNLITARLWTQLCDWVNNKLTVECKQPKNTPGQIYNKQNNILNLTF